MVTPIGKEHWLTRQLEQQPDVVHSGLWTVVKPVRHFVRRLLAYDKAEQNGLYGVWSVQSLWEPLFPTELEDTIGFSIAPFQGTTAVVLEGTPAPIPYEVFRDRMEQFVLPYLRSIDSMERLYQEITDKRANLTAETPESSFCLELAMGNFDSARNLAMLHRDLWFWQDVGYLDQEEVERTRQLCRLLDDGNYGGIALLLHEREALAAEYSELDNIWEPSPFPFEPGYGDWLRRSYIDMA